MDDVPKIENTAGVEPQSSEAVHNEGSFNENIDDSDLSPEAKLRIEAEMEEYVRKLVKKYRRKSDDAVITEKTTKYHQALVEREIHQEQREIDEIRKEERFRITTNMKVSLAIMTIFIIWAVKVSDKLGQVTGAISGFFVEHFNWFYILISTGFLIYLTFLAFSRFGGVVLGDPDSKPEFSNFSWYSMLFSAGMGVGLLFWGAAEPITHFIHPPVGEPRSIEAARMAMVYASFHWGIHGWAIYAMCAVGLAYFGFRKRKKYLVSSSIMDFFGNRKLNNALKIFADIFATIVIIFGVAPSLGMGTKLIASGMHHVFNINSENNTGYIVIIAVLVTLFIISAVAGLKKGIKLLSDVNVIVAALLMVFVFVVGPKLFILKVFVNTIGDYITALGPLGFRVAPFTPSYQEWMGKWTLMYFTWWIAWAPFVGIFIARISKGRTIKELILGTLLVPTIFTILWFSVFGGTALNWEMFTNYHGVSIAVDKDPSLALYAVLQQFPFYKIVSAVSVFLMVTFLVTSADSATFVIAMMTTEGDLDPKTWIKILWGLVLAIASALILTGGGIESLMSAALCTAFPFSLIMILIAISVLVRLSIQVKKERI